MLPPLVPRERSPVLRAYIKILSLDPKLDNYVRKQHTWRNALATLADHRHSVRLHEQRKGQDRGGGAAPTELWITLWVMLVILDKGH